MADSDLITRERLANYHDELMKDVANPLGEKKANIDGFYEGMGVGVAKHLEGNVNNPGSFLERTTGGDAELANGLAQLNEVQGGSVKFNQLENLNTSFTLVNVGETERKTVIYGYNFVANHAYYFRCLLSDTIYTEDANNKFGLQIGDAEKLYFNIADGYVSGIASTLDTGSYLTRIFYFILAQSAQGTQATISNVNIIDLTAIFGTGNEPESVEAFEAWLAENVGVKDYYDYTENKVVNNNMTGIESNGFNLFNPTTGKARIIGAYSEVYGNYYGIRGTYGTLTFEDDLGNVSTVTPDADGKAEFDVPGYINVDDAGNDVAVFLWWDGKKTEYEDYDVDIARLDVRHIYGKKNGTGDLVQVWPTGVPGINDIVDKLCIENGAVVAKRNLGEVDMGSLYWRYGTTADSMPVFYAFIEGKNLGSINVVCSKYSTNRTRNIAFSGSGFDDKTIYKTSSANGYIYITDSSYSNSATFKTAVTGQKLYYELATPETYTDLVYMGSEYFADGTPVTLPVNYKVDNWGVESILPKNTSTILTAKPTIKVRYAIDAVEQLNTHSDEIENLYDGLDELDEAKANTVGVYDDMVVGAAKAIAGNQRLDKVFTSMVVEGADGVAKINEVRGKSLVWNQLCNTTFGLNHATKTDNADGSYTITQSSTESIPSVRSETATSYLRANTTHKYYFSVKVKGEEGGEPYGDVCFGCIAYSGTYLSQFGVKVSLSGVYQKVSFLSSVNFQESRVPGIVSDPTDKAASFTFRDMMAVDLTKMFGAGNEPATVEEFESMFPDAYYEYNAGEIINNTTEELDIYDSEETLKSTLPLNLSTITGKQVGVEDAESVVIFPDGMRQAGSAADTLLVDDDGYARRVVVKIGSEDLGNKDFSRTQNTGMSSYYFRTVISDIKPAASSRKKGNLLNTKYKETDSNTVVGASGTNEDKVIAISGTSNNVVIRDDSYTDATAFKAAVAGVELIYELAEYKEYILDEPILMTFKAYHGGTIVQSPQVPDSAPMSMNVTFALDAVGTLNNLPKNYISADSMDACLAQLGTAMNGTWTKSWDAANNRYGFTFTPNA